MYAALFWWQFDNKPAEFYEQLRRYIGDESWPRYVGREGLRQKVWFSNEQTQQWGALAVWEDESQMEADIEAALASARVKELTGGVPPRIERLQVEALQEGQHAGRPLDEVGLAKRPPAS
jgi:hypothetical protein